MDGIKRIYLFTLLVCLLSCDRPECTNTNEIFDTFDPHAKEYREELANQLQTTADGDLTYWFDRYELYTNREYIVVHVQADELCANATVVVEHWEGIEEIKKTKGQGYRGAQLVGFEMGTRKTSRGIEFIFNDIDQIID
jgi:hypothetical protein